MRTLSFTRFRDWLIVVFSSGRPSDREWAEYVEFMQRYNESAQQPRVVAVTYGGMPDPGQRQMLARLNASYYESAKVAFITSSTFAQGVILAMQRLYPPYRIFPPEAIDDALTYVELPRSYFDEVKRRVSSLAAEVGGDPRS